MIVWIFFHFYAFGGVVGEHMWYMTYIINAHYGIIYKGCYADLFLEGNRQANW